MEDTLNYYLNGAFKDKDVEKAETVIRLFTKHHCPVCETSWESDTTFVPDGAMYEARCPKCNMLIKKKNCPDAAIKREVPILIKQQFCVVYRGIDGTVETVICDKLTEAVAKQCSLCFNISVEVANDILKAETYKAVYKELAERGRCEIETDKGDSYIFSMPSKT